MNEGRASGSVDQHCSINFLHSGSQRSGTGGRRVFFKIPPALLFHQTGSHIRDNYHRELLNTTWQAPAASYNDMMTLRACLVWDF